MNHRRSFLAIWLFLFVVSAKAQNPVNALWNDSGPKGTVGFWVYPISGKCPDLRKKATPVISFSARADQSTANVQDLRYCFELPKQEDKKSILCKSGSVSFEPLEAGKTYKGKLNLTMVDGSKRQIEFVAAFCPKEVP